jgi:hypothetical protein
MMGLVSGVLVWSGAHLFKRVAPEARARLGNAGRPLMALLLLASVVLMTWVTSRPRRRCGGVARPRGLG